MREYTYTREISLSILAFKPLKNKNIPIQCIRFIKKTVEYIVL